MRKPKAPDPTRRQRRSGKPQVPRIYPNRLRELSAAGNLTYAEVAEAVGGGTHEVTIANLATGKQKMTQPWMEKLARVFGCEPADILRSSNTRGLLRVRVTGMLQAGAWQESFELPDDDQFDVMIPADSELQAADLYAGQITGQSMNRVYPDCAVVVLSRRLNRPGEIAIGKRYHVRRVRPDGMIEDTIKTLDRGPDGRYWLKPESNDPEHQEWLPLDGTPDATVELIGRVRFVVYRED